MDGCIWRKNPEKSHIVTLVGNKINGVLVAKEGFTVIKYKGKTGQTKFRCVQESQLSPEKVKVQPEVEPLAKFKSLEEFIASIYLLNGETAFPIDLNNSKSNNFKFRMKATEQLVEVEIIKDANKQISSKAKFIVSDGDTKVKDLQASELAANGYHLLLKTLKENHTELFE